MTTTKTIKPKDLLERDIEIKVGDFVTTNDDSELIKAMVVKDIDQSIATVCYICMTVTCDDIYVQEEKVELSSLLYLGDSFVNVNGHLWKIRESIVN